MRYLLDSNAYDAILRHGDADWLLAHGDLDLIASAVVLAELRQTTNAARRQLLLELYFALHGSAPEAAPTLASRDALLLAEARAADAVLVSEDKALQAAGALSYVGFRALL